MPGERRPRRLQSVVRVVDVEIATKLGQPPDDDDFRSKAEWMTRAMSRCRPIIGLSTSTHPRSRVDDPRDAEGRAPPDPCSPRHYDELPDVIEVVVAEVAHEKTT